MTKPYTLYTAPTPNGRKAAIFFEEAGLPYEMHFIDILAGDQHTPEFLKLNPNNKLPVLIDPDGPNGEEFVLWESGAILWYLAEKTGRFLPKEGADRHIVHQWLMFQMANLGPMAGQFGHFFFYAKEKHPYSIERYGNELNRQMGVMDRHLEGREWFAGDDFSIADMAIFPWVGLTLDNPELPRRPNMIAWSDRMKARPGVMKGMSIMTEDIRPEIVEGGHQGFGDEHRDQLFGDSQYARNE
ncbi:MAG: glutathione S-transferase N-terminal domain-containing protein [Pseudomonadota bacterium]